MDTQAVGPAGDLMAFALRGHQVEIDRLVARLKEDRLPAIAALGHVVRDPGDDHARQSRHVRRAPAILASRVARAASYAINMAPP